MLATDLAGVALVNPVLLAAGTCGYLDEFADAIDLARVGGVVTKSITVRPRPGNTFPRVIDARAGMLNAVGLANVGVEHFAEHIAPRAADVPTVVIGSVAGFSIDDFVTVAAAMDDAEGIRAVELNVSCPNVDGGAEFGADPEALAELVGAVRPVLAETRLFVKLSPIAVGAPGMVEVARAAIRGAGVPAGPDRRTGADALCIANTIPAMAIDVRTRRPRLSNVTGGLSGPAVHNVAVKLVYDVCTSVTKEAGVPVVGVGGVMRWEDAAEFILAGASAVQMGTALFADPRSPLRVIDGLRRWVRSQGAQNISELVGTVEI
ncbi:MAG: dihydroorotate dehydrogenase [Planctomycetes bacterium]|nr:dihydroorotate dehydrogenase [Planctomycetota bacterium]